MRYVVFDIETQNIFQEIETNNPADLDIAVVSVYDSRTDSYTTVTVDDLSTLWPIFEQAEALVGYNSDHFDIPLLNKYYPGDLTQIKSIDLLADIKDSLGRRIRLDNVANATIGSKKSGSGLQSITWWREGKIDKVKKYCEQDVKITKEVFEFALKNAHVKFKDGLKKRDIPLDTSNWVPHQNVSLTHSLPF